MDKTRNLEDLITNLKQVHVLGPINKIVTGIAYDSKKTCPNFLFVAISGNLLDGHSFIPDAISRGSTVIVCEKNPQLFLSNHEISSSITWLIVPNSREVLAILADSYFCSPSRQVKVLGITGTNGKTTTSYLLEAILSQEGSNVGVVGTINYRWANATTKAKQTTPESLDLQEILANMRAARIRYCILEISSHGIKQSRITGCRFEGVLFTNLGRDHLDYHKDLQEYFETKASLFTDFPKEWALINIDDPFGQKIRDLSPGKVFTYGIQKHADFRAVDIQITQNGISFHLEYFNGQFRISSKLLGRHNVYNMLAACAAASLCGLSLQNVNTALENLDFIPGRLERVEAGQNFNVLIDFAHTPDALDKAIMACREFTAGKVIVVFGCGGNRDKGKRPLMGEIAARLSDYTFITSDNPRREDPQAIVNDITDKIIGNRHEKNWTVLLDRREAIFAAIEMARGGDTVLIAGKGHEQEQLLGVNILPFSDNEVAREAIVSLHKTHLGAGCTCGTLP